MPIKEYVGLSRIVGPLVVVQGVSDVGYEDLVEIVYRGERRAGQVVLLEEDKAVVQVFEGTKGLIREEARVRFLGEPLKVSLSRN
ncbi:MAG: V-type ATP synthase subunit B, partial [Candidatus Atribacteria bacterium]|nr:V-type ATP synthase subunit B [Candidatus Atribacteria bacterium]MCD6349490.1 V-type ATP synthase subunit B [Candidatus Atribacteria bacterium]